MSNTDVEHIKIRPVSPKTQYVGNGRTREFQTVFAFFAEDNIVVYLNDKIISSGFKITGVGNSEGGTVTFDVAPKKGENITIIRDIVIERITDFQEGGTFRAKNINDEFDRLTAVSQQVNEVAKRAIVFPPFYAGEYNSELPRPEAKKALVWNDSGTALRNSVVDFDQVESDTKKYRDEALKAKNESVSASVRSESSAVRSDNSAKKAENVVKGFDAHAAEKQNAFDVNAATLTARYDNNDLAKTKAFNQNAQNMTDGFNKNAMLKIDDFDAHYAIKEMEFDDHAAIKQGEVDASASKAKQSELNAKNSENAAGISEDNARDSERKSRIWAEGEDPEVENLGGVHSSKGWALIAEGAIAGQGLVTIDTDQDITGHKTFKSDQAINSPNLDIRTDRSKRGNGLIFTDKNGTQTAGIGVYINNNQSPECRLVASNGTQSAFAGLGVTTDGQGFFEVPTPSADSNNRDAVNSEWIKPKLDTLQTAINGKQPKGDYATNTALSNGLLTKADKDLSNTGRISNCITEIPQDIKVELKDGTLTLKAGSKVYIPNGVGRFDVVNIDRDYIIGSIRLGAQDILLFWNNDTKKFVVRTTKSCFSGDNDPSGDYITWYDTRENKIKNFGKNHTFESFSSFPLCVYKDDGSKIISIDQVFNGFGYIDSTQYILPAVKMLLPNGRNADGSMKNIEIVTSKVILNYYDFRADNQLIALSQTGNQSGRVTRLSGFYVQTNKPSRQYAGWYNPETNLIYYSGASLDNFKLYPMAVFCQEINTDSTGRITLFDVKTAFHAVDYSDFEKLDNSVVHKTGNETITGDKIISGHLSLTRHTYFKANNYDLGTKPTQTMYADTNVDFTDSKNKSFGYIQSTYDTEQTVRMQLGAKNYKTDGSAIYNKLDLVTKKDGNFWAEVNTPPTSANGKEIATTAWVRDKGVLIESKFNADKSWYRKYSDGWLEQGQSISTNNITITFAKPFKNTNYTIIGAGWNSGGLNQQQIYDKTTTGFKVRQTGGRTASTEGWLAIGQGA